MKRFSRLQRGQATALVALLMTCLTAGAALAVDVGAAYAHKQRCQSVIEAAALAAATHLPSELAARATAYDIITANGLDTSKVTVETPYTHDVSRVYVYYTDLKPTYFAKTLGINLFQINMQAIAKHGGPEVFDFALFSGSTFEYLDVSGADVVVHGHVHGNEDVRIRGANVSVTGQIEASNIVDVRGSTVSAGAIVNYVDPVPMPTYNIDTLRAICTIRHIGDKHWSGVNINVTGNVFVEGNLKLSGCTVSGSGMIICSGNIELAGTDLRYATATDQVALYSLRDIKITGVNYYADGIIYAPTGEIDCHGASLTVNGAIVADLLDISGVDVTVYHDAEAKNAFFGGSAVLTR